MSSRQPRYGHHHLSLGLKTRPDKRRRRKTHRKVRRRQSGETFGRSWNKSPTEGRMHRRIDEGYRIMVAAAGETEERRTPGTLNDQRRNYLQMEW